MIEPMPTSFNWPPPVPRLRGFRSGVLAAALVAGLALSAAASPVTLRVAVPSATPPADLVYVAGDFQGWNAGNPAFALARQPDGRWAITLDLTAGAPIQFKFTRGSWDNVEKGVNGEEIANRALTPQSGATYDFTVATWRDLGTLTGHVESFTFAPFLGGRRCWVYLPAGYDTSLARYPVLYMHDGQNLFDVRTSFAGEWHVDETCEALIAAGEIEPLIVVGIENGPARCSEYTPWSYAGQPCAGGGGDAYLAAIRDVLIPQVDARYRTLAGRNHRYLCGSSLGGLISAYAGYAYDDVFSRVAAVSPSYWWDNLHVVAYAQARGRPNLTRFYQDMGTLEAGSTTDANANGIDDYIESLRAMRDVALSQGFVQGVDFMSVEAAGHTHSETYWAQRFPNLLRFLAGAPLIAAPGPRDEGTALALQAVPNPMRGESRIEFTLAAPSPVRLEVLDLTGRRVRIVAAGWLGAGRHSLRWNRVRDGGARLGAGVYWLRLEAGDARAGRKLVVID